MTAEHDGDAPNVFASVGNEAGMRTMGKGREFTQSANCSDHPGAEHSSTCKDMGEFRYHGADSVPRGNGILLCVRGGKSGSKL